MLLSNAPLMSCIRRLRRRMYTKTTLFHADDSQIAFRDEIAVHLREQRAGAACSEQPMSTAVSPVCVLSLAASFGNTHVEMLYETPVTAFGFGSATPALNFPPANPCYLPQNLRRCSGPGLPNETLPVYDPLICVCDASNAVGPADSPRPKYCVALYERTVLP